MSFTLKTQFEFFIRCPHGNVHLMGVSDSGGGGGTLIFSYIRGLGPSSWDQHFEFQYFFLFFRKMNIFWGIKNIFFRIQILKLNVRFDILYSRFKSNNNVELSLLSIFVSKNANDENQFWSNRIKIFF